MTAPFILASASPRRLSLLAQIGLHPARVIASGIDETPRKGELPDIYASRMAMAKARAASQAGTIVLAADTVVACGRRILPKAENEAQARQCLSLLSGRRHRVYTAIMVIDAAGREHSRVAMTQVRFKRLHASEIDAYIACGEWQGCAGGYAIQGQAAALIPWIGGSYDTVVGLPLYDAVQLLRRASAAS